MRVLLGVLIVLSTPAFAVSKYINCGSAKLRIEEGSWLSSGKLTLQRSVSHDFSWSGKESKVTQSQIQAELAAIDERSKLDNLPRKFLNVETLSRTGETFFKLEGRSMPALHPSKFDTKLFVSHELLNGFAKEGTVVLLVEEYGAVVLSCGP